MSAPFSSPFPLQVLLRHRNLDAGAERLREEELDQRPLLDGGPEASVGREHDRLAGVQGLVVELNRRNSPLNDSLVCRGN